MRDGRRLPIQLAWAAARYLKDLYAIYGDWSLVIAAYNCGPGNVNKAIRRTNGDADYWKIYNFLPKETRGYVPAFIAINYIMNYYCNHNICALETNIPTHTDTIQINRKLHLQQVSDICGIEMEQLKSLNPQYKRDIIPGDAKTAILRLPLEQVSLFIDNQDTIYAHRYDELFKNRKTVAVPSPQTTTRSKAGSGTLSYHTIRNGETLGSIAAKYKVSVKNLQSWNGLSNTRISAGKKLKIYK